MTPEVLEMYDIKFHPDGRCDVEAVVENSVVVMPQTDYDPAEWGLLCVGARSIFVMMTRCLRPMLECDASLVPESTTGKWWIARIGQTTAKTLRNEETYDDWSYGQNPFHAIRVGSDLKICTNSSSA
jgi:hypothetical protein